MKLRPALLRWHRWFGIGAAAWLFALAASGSLLVFYAPFDRWLNPDLLTVQSRGTPLPFSTLFTLARAARPDARVISVALDRTPGSSAMALLGPLPGKELKTAPNTQLFIDPYRGRVLGQRVFGSSVFDRHHLPSLVYQFHVDWLLGAWMTSVLGFVALLWVIDHAIGLALALTSAKRWTHNFVVRWTAKGHKRTFDLHRAGGMWLFPITATLALTGLTLAWYADVAGVIGRVSPLSPTPTALIETPPPAGRTPGVGIDAAVAAAWHQAPGATIGTVADYPDNGIYWLNLYDPRDLDPFPGRWITVDRTDGRVIQDRHISEGSAGDTVLAWQLPLHSGKVFGWPGRIVIFLAGILLCGMIVTGLMIWQRKAAGRRAQPARAQRTRTIQASGRR